MPLPRIVVEGTAVADPELRYTPNGHPVCSIRVACNDRKRQPDGTWADGPTTFLDVSAWRQLGEHIANSVTKGSRIVVTGRLSQREWQDREGNRRTAYQVDADDVAVSLLFVDAEVKRVERAEPAPAAPAANTDPWASTDVPPW